MNARTDDISFRRVLAAPYADSTQLRDALDIEVNGRSLSLMLASAPFDIDVAEGLVCAWSRNNNDVAVLNCTCGDVDCGGIFVDVLADDRTITWTSTTLGASLVFDRAEFETSLARALSE